MNALCKNCADLLAIAVFGMSSMALSSSPAWSAAAPAAANEAKQDWAKRHQEWVKRYTDNLAERLEIKASQQGAWQSFVKTVEAVTERPATKPEAKSDAASIARLDADLAATRAQRLAQIADATAKLQEALNPDQRKTLDQIAAETFRRQHHFHGGGHWDHHKQGGGLGEGRDREQH